MVWDWIAALQRKSHCGSLMIGPDSSASLKKTLRGPLWEWQIGLNSMAVGRQCGWKKIVRSSCDWSVLG